MRKVYARDNMNYMKPHIECYKAVDKDISKVIRSDDNKYIFEYNNAIKNLEIKNDTLIKDTTYETIKLTDIQKEMINLLL